MTVYLLDKSALARVRLQPEVARAFEQLADAGILATSPIIELELGYSARNLVEFDSVATDRAEFYRELPLSSAIGARAREVQRELVRIGAHRSASVPDLLIAATAELHDAVVVHYDRDYDTIARITSQQTQWIVPAGSVP